jgi:Flp pilus assembly protein TadB
MRPARQAAPVRPGDELPSDVMLVVGALAVVIVVAAIIIGVLVSSVIVALIIAAIGLLALFFTVRASRH